MLNTSHPFINREQTYFLDRKLISIHSVDRDISKWPNSSHFEVDLPQYLNNVYSLRLTNINIPSNFYTFTNSYQNTKLEITIGTSNETITISEGYYTPEELANELEGQLNSGIFSNFVVKYDKIRHKMVIANTVDPFTLNADTKITYTDLPCGQQEIWSNYSNWGLPYNLGFNKQSYPSLDVSAINFYYDNTQIIPTSPVDSSNVYYVESIECLDIFVQDSIYLELDKYNSMDEIDPYSDETTKLFNNDYTGRTDSAFAKIPLLNEPFNKVQDSRSNSINNVTFFKVPIPRIKKLKFKFRFHNGMLVDFCNMPFSFTIEANQLIDEQARRFQVNAPFIYST